MTASDKKMAPDFFDEHVLDPVAAATGGAIPRQSPPKRKAGFYFSETLLNRFNRMFHQLKLDGVPIDSKSALAEMALSYALDDMDRGADSQLLGRLNVR
jgi:hypothetical protein